VTWSRLLPNCPVCGLGLERGEEGYWLGAYFFNLTAVEAVFSIWVVAFLVWTWPTPPWEFFQVSTIVLMVVFPFLFFPFSKTLFLAFDLWVRPATDEDFVVPHEEARNLKRDQPS
jgi:prepilin signal peptidase PulO-like enzyme (type II secretory pathway)